jgi:hypothetical protein
VWQSAQLPPMVVTAFPTAPADERNRFQENLANLCDNEGQSACAQRRRLLPGQRNDGGEIEVLGQDDATVFVSA